MSAVLPAHPVCPLPAEGGGLHLGLLVFVGKQILGEGDLTLLKLRPSGRTHQRADIGHHCQLLLVKQRLQFGEFG